MAAALEYQSLTGDSKYVTEFLQTGSWTRKTPTAKTYNFKVNTD
ncbi:hypothetical protein [Chryseobacterium arthrosphaerae]|nr:hypothetical protein [Chryseobacterium arthrosphaerae]